MKLIHLFFILLSVIAIFGCSSSSINYDYDHTQIFDGYKTYNFKDHSELNLAESLTIDIKLYSDLKNSINKVLENKGFTLTENGKEDFLVLIHRDLIPQDSLYNFHPWWLPCGSSLVSSFENNSLVIDITDNGSGLIWRGLAPKFFNTYSNIKFLQKKLNDVVSEILAGFPPN